MPLSFLLSAAKLTTQVIQTANRNVFNTPGVLDLVNEISLTYGGDQFSSDGRTLNPGFKLGGRGYDVTVSGGYPTIWIECPNGYSFKVALDSRVDAALDENK